MAKARGKKRPARKPIRKRTSSTARKKRTDEACFTESLIAHDQGVKRTAGAKLPPGATHELVEDACGGIKPVRKRFSSL